jgi:photosystem II stability/assembly factor-like uncharacterized protein
VFILTAPTGIYRGQGAAQPQRVAGRRVILNGGLFVRSRGNFLFTYGSDSVAMYVSTNQGRSWKKVKLPKRVDTGFGDRVADFVTPRLAFFVDSRSRIWRTRNAGKSWAQILSAGGQVDGISMTDASNGYLQLSGNFGTAHQGQFGFTLRTSDGGRTWRPQSIARGVLRDAIATSAQQGYALIEDNHLFVTNTGGDAGTPTTISLRTKVKKLTPKAFKKAKGHVTVTGTIPGAVGGEQVVVSRRYLGAGEFQWSHQVVTAGANGGSFTTSWRIGRSAVFVAKWAGDSGRRGAGSVPLVISVKR